MSLPTFWYFFRKAVGSSTSRSMGRYNTAMDFGTPIERIVERLRRAVRELFAFWVFLSLGAMYYLDRTVGGWEDQNLYAAMLIALVIFVPVWGLYRLIRFGLMR